MNKNYILIAGLALAFGSNIFAASKCWFWQLDCKVQEALENYEKEPATKATIDELCKKGYFSPMEWSENKFSLRSFEGRACSLFPEWAAAYLAFCSKALSPEEFQRAHCFEKALNTLGIEKTENLTPAEITDLQKKATGIIENKIKERAAAALEVLRYLLCSSYPETPLICGGKKEKE